MLNALTETENLDKYFDMASNLEANENKIIYDNENNNLKSEELSYVLTMKREDIDDEKEMNKFIKTCESMIRMSPEYKDWTSYIRTVMNMTKCQITGEYHEHAKSDIHHHPITLFIIVKGVILKYISNETPFCSIDIINEVMDLHYKMQTPFVVLLKSIHELYHSGNLLLPMELVQGDISYFIQNYGHYLDEDELGPILDKLKINWNTCGYSKEKYNWSNKS